ncbi:hypothetical protein [Burkholderia arboris]|uniref:hypothetical protein n=1 Tax=Burkholderia arboris TaxID=488730 RepID=UPI00158C029C|nr:hypothetical protein [Burkholderia arboris]
MNRDQATRLAGSGCDGEPAGSARDSWISPVDARKSLIVEGTAALRRMAIATSRSAFAMSPADPRAAAASFSSLFKALKEKKKEYEEAAATGRHRTPRVGRALPSVAIDAAVSRHGLGTAATHE